MVIRIPAKQVGLRLHQAMSGIREAPREMPKFHAQANCASDVGGIQNPGSVEGISQLLCADGKPDQAARDIAE
jgi:hypothetical protein